MKPVVVIMAAVAVLAALATAFLAQRWVAGQAARPVAAQPAATAEVLVVARDVPAGATLSSDDLRYDTWPASVAQNFIARKGDDPKAQFLGMVPRRPLVEGEPFPTSAVTKLDGGLLAVILEPGMRAVSVAITNASAVSGFINPGDRVDVVLAADFQRADQEVVGKGGPIVRYASETVLKDVKVLAIDQQVARGKDGAAIQGKTATLAVSPKQAEIIVAAGMLGQLSLALRPQADENATAAAEPPPPGTPPFTADIEASDAMKTITHGGGKSGDFGIRINRAGVVSTRSF